MSFILCIETGTDTCSVALAADGRLVALRESHGERDHAARVAVYTEEVLAQGGIAARDLAAVAVSKGPGSYTGLRIGVSFAKGLCYGLGVPLMGVGSLESLCAEAITNYELRITSEASIHRRRPAGQPQAGAVKADGGNYELQITNYKSGFSSEAGGCKACDGAETAVYPDVNEDFGDERNAADARLSRKTLIPMIDARRMEVYGQVFDGGGNALTAPEAWIIDEGSLSEWRGRGEVFIFGSGAEKCREALPWAHYIDVEPSARGMVGLASRAFEAADFENTAYFEPFYLKDFVVTTSKKRLF